MTATFRLSVILVLFFVAFTGPTAQAAQFEKSSVSTVCTSIPTNLQAAKTSPTSVVLTWEDSGSAPSYTVKVRNMTTGQTEQSFQTSNTWANVGNLKVNNQYSFEVKANDYIIIDTTEM